MTTAGIIPPVFSLLLDTLAQSNHQHMRAITFVSILLVSCSAFAQPEKSGAKYLNPADMDITAKAGDDFRQYSGGTWLQKNPVPPKYTSWGAFTIVRDFNVKAVRDILTEVSSDKTAPAGSLRRRVGDFYAAGMDSIAIEKAGFEPARPDYNRAGAVKTTADVLGEIAYQRSHNVSNPLFGFSVQQDRKHPTVMIMQVSQGGISMSDRDYYLKNDDRSKKIRAAFNAYMVTLFMLAGETEETAKRRAESVFALEKTLAAGQMSRVEMRDPYKTYNKYAVNDLVKSMPNSTGNRRFKNWRCSLPTASWSILPNSSPRPTASCT